MAMYCNPPRAKDWVYTGKISRGAFLRGSVLTALSATKTFAWVGAMTRSLFCQDQPASARWSEAARNQLKDMQEKAYAQLGKRLGMGNDPLKVYQSLSRGRIPAERISWERFAEEMGPTLGKAEVEKQKQAFEEYKKYYTNTVLPTPYEDPNLYLILLPYADGIEEVAKGENLPIPRHLLFGTVPATGLDAQSILVGTKDYIVVFQYGIFTFLNEMSTLAARVLPPLISDNGKKRFQTAPDPVAALKTHPEILEQFIKILYSFVAGDPRLEPANFPLDSAYKLTAGQLLICMELFILGHEYTHIIYHHLEDQARFQGSHEEKMRAAQQSEYDADTLGVGLMCGVMSETDLKLTLWAPDYYFSCMDIVRACVAILKNSPDVFYRDPSHPSFSARRNKLRADLQKSRPGAETESSIKLGQQLEECLTRLWVASLPIWEAGIRNGVKLSPIWQ